MSRNKEIITNGIDIEDEINTLAGMFRKVLINAVPTELTEELHDELDNTFEEFSMNFTERQYNDWLAAGYTREQFEELESFILNFALGRL